MVIMNDKNLNTKCTVHCSGDGGDDGDDGDVKDKNDDQSNDDDNN